MAELLERIGRRHHRSDGSLSDHLRHVRPRACPVWAARDAVDDALRTPALGEVRRGQATKRDIAVARTQSFAVQLRVPAVRAIQDAVDLAKAVRPVGRPLVSRSGPESTPQL